MEFDVSSPATPEAVEKARKTLMVKKSIEAKWALFLSPLLLLGMAFFIHFFIQSVIPNLFDKPFAYALYIIGCFMIFAGAFAIYLGFKADYEEKFGELRELNPKEHAPELKRLGEMMEESSELNDYFSNLGRPPYLFEFKGAEKYLKDYRYYVAVAQRQPLESKLK
jgi:hypothetical protein